MPLLSHGRGSSLLEHMREVASSAQTLEERVTLLCHDVGKAASDWQTFIANPGGKRSPFPHAAAGGLLAAMVILEHSGWQNISDALLALHVGAAHHTEIKVLDDDKGLESIACDIKAKTFFLDRQSGIASQLPEIEDKTLEAAWCRFQSCMMPLSSERRKLNSAFESLSEEMRLMVFIRSRDLLGRLCLLDHQSAAWQSAHNVPVAGLEAAFPQTNFTIRTPRCYPPSKTRIHDLRAELKHAFNNVVARRQDAVFYFIDAPTGLGKTEAMLSAAEQLCQQHNFNHVIYAVPQVSIADQIFEEYLRESDAQIWNYRRKEKTAATVEKPLSENDCFVELHPFSESYNVTTFNQVLLAMCHPNRKRCVRGFGLRNAVVVMDEFHKLPMSILPLFFRIARTFANTQNCRFILGSATPLEALDYWDLHDSARLETTIAKSIYSAPEVDLRRVYRSLGSLSIDEVGDKVEAFHSDSKNKNLLVVLNLIADGTIPLLERFCGSFNPFAQLERIRKADACSERLIVVLDGLVPPVIRRALICACKEAMKKPGATLTLITTQLVEVGVDLDFDAAFVDYQGLASVIQRGGRVGREGRDQPCDVFVFALLDDNGATSWERLLAYQEKNDPRSTLSAFQKINAPIKDFQRKEMRFFKKMNAGQEFHDSDLANQLQLFQQQSFSEQDGADLVCELFDIRASGRLGMSYENAQLIAELFTDDHTDPILLIDTPETLSRIQEFAQRTQAPHASAEDKKMFFGLLSDYTITVSRAADILERFSIRPFGHLVYPDEIKAYMVGCAML